MVSMFGVGLEVNRRVFVNFMNKPSISAPSNDDDDN